MFKYPYFKFVPKMLHIYSLKIKNFIFLEINTISFRFAKISKQGRKCGGYKIWTSMCIGAIFSLHKIIYAILIFLLNLSSLLLELYSWKFLDGPVIGFSLPGAQVQSLVEEFRSHEWYSATKRKKKKKRIALFSTYLRIKMTILKLKCCV